MKTIGAITIGQAPRTDIYEDIESLIPEGVRFLQCGALDGLTKGEIVKLAPDEGDNVLVSRLTDGTGVVISEQKVLPLVQKRMDELQEKGADAILIMCTGTFPETFASAVPLVYPSKLICGIVSSLNGIKSIGIVTPEASQFSDIEVKWLAFFDKVYPVQWNPYNEKASEKVINELKAANVDLIVMDCFGYGKSMRNFIAEGTQKPVILSRTIAVRNLLEII